MDTLAIILILLVLFIFALWIGTPSKDYTPECKENDEYHEYKSFF